MTKQKVRIVTLTMNPSIDISMSADSVVAQHKIRCSTPRYESGGGGINVARVVISLGGSVHAVFPSGGNEGAMLQDLVKNSGIEYSNISTEKSTRMSFAVYDKSNENQFRFNAPGPSLTKQEWRQCLDYIEGFEPAPDYIVASGSLPPNVPDVFYEHIALCAKKRNIRFILDTSGTALKKGARKGVYLLKPNMREMRALSGKELDHEQEIIDTLKELIDKGTAEVIVLSLGAGGAFLATDKTVKRMHTPTVPIRSAVGAGDSMVGGITVALSQGKSISDSVRMGLAAGAAAVMTPGTELCRRDDVLSLYDKISTELE
ncbi:MAG: hexose kinase [Chitinivibrionales bacterium]|nr:hexose kinase [Chitinivibrionales bacterium]